MKNLIKVTAAAAALAIVGGTFAATAASHHSSDQGAPASSRVASPNLAVDTAVETKFTSIAPCRIVDTRLAGGAIAANSSRSFHAIGSGSFAGQGGQSCGIPSAAVALEASITAIGATGSGFMKAWAFGGASPVAAYVNYSAGLSLRGSGTIPINGTGADAFTTKAYSHSTQITVDVTGYFITPMRAQVLSTGALVPSKSSRVTGVVNEPVGTGTYTVDFDRDVSNCTYNVSAFDSTHVITTQPRSGDANGVFVKTTNLSGTATADTFYLTVTC